MEEIGLEITNLIIKFSHIRDINQVTTKIQIFITIIILITSIMIIIIYGNTIDTKFIYILPILIENLGNYLLYI